MAAPILAPVIVGFGLVGVYGGLQFMKQAHAAHRRASHVRGTETTEVQNIQPGTVEIKGTARPTEDQSVDQAPISDKEALVTYVEVSNRRGDGWYTELERTNTRPLLIDDGTGQVRVEPPDEGRVNLDTDMTEVKYDQDPPDQVARFYESEPELDEQSGRTKFYEGVLEPGNEAYVLGEAKETKAGWGEERYVVTGGSAPEKFVLSDMSEQNLAASEMRRAKVRFVLGLATLLFGIGLLSITVHQLGVL